MSRKSGVVILLILISVLCHASSDPSQCSSKITLVPQGPMAVASKARGFARFKYPMIASDSLLIQSYEDTETSIGPYDIGFEIVRSGSVLKRVFLRDLPEMRREEPDYADSFSTLTVTRACEPAGPVFFVTMQYQGDATSPALIFVLAPSPSSYVVSTLPMISGGVLEVSRSNPTHIRTWDNLHEGNCEACETAYEIVEYEIRNGKPVETKQYRTRHKYASPDFDGRRRIRFIQ